MFRLAADYMCRLMGRTITLRRQGLDDEEFTGVIRGIRAADLMGSAVQSDMLVVIPATQISGRPPKKFDRIVAGGRQWTIQFVRECYDGEELCMYKATVRG